MTRNVPGRCILCGSVGVTKEHIFGEWTNKYLPSTGEYTQIRYGPGGAGKPKNAGALSALMKPRILCAKCNRGLGKAVEEPAERAGLGLMMDPRLDHLSGVRLSVGQQRAIATWATKVALFIPYTYIETGVSDAKHLAQFHKYQRPPRTFAVWLGLYAGEGGLLHTSWDGRTRIVVVSRQKQYEGRIITFFLGHVIGMVFAGRGSRPYKRNEPDPHSGALLRLWPPRRSAIRWPKAHFDPESITRLVRQSPPLPEGNPATRS